VEEKEAECEEETLSETEDDIGDNITFAELQTGIENGALLDGSNVEFTTSQQSSQQSQSSSS
jgi:hypothetical protein